MEAATKTIARDLRAEARVLAEHDKKVLALAAYYAADIDDLAQVGRIALLEAVRTWARRPDDSHTAQFWTYARRRVVGAMINYLTREVTERSRFELADEVGDAPDTSPLTSPELASAVKQSVERLSSEERSVLSAALAGRGTREISEELHVSNNQVGRLLAKLGAQ